MSAEGSPFSGTTRVLAVDVTPERAADVSEALRELVERLPAHPAIVPVVDAGVTDGRAYLVTPVVDGEPLEDALREYGPAALTDALPRLQQLADALDLAADRGLCHGMLTPADILVSVEDTRIIGIGVINALRRADVGLLMSEVYAAPEVLDGNLATAKADQFSLAVIAHEWLLGRAPTNRADMGVMSVPGTNRELFASALAKAVATDPSERFATSADLVVALASSSLRAEDASEGARKVADGRRGAPLALIQTHTEEAELPLQPPDATDSGASAVVTRVEWRGYGPLSISAALVIGLTLGAIGMWWLASSAPTDESQEAVSMPDTPRDVTEAEVNPARDDRIATASLSPGATGPPAALDAGLLIHSAPAGAAVSIDGVARGTTPIAVRGLELGTRRVVVSRPGFRTVERQVALSSDRPSRTLEVELARLPTPAATSSPVAEGSVVFDTRPAGASVYVEGRAVGVTPMTLTLPPGQHAVRMERAGYRAVSTRVVVRAGERTRVAARLEGGLEQ